MNFTGVSIINKRLMAILNGQRGVQKDKLEMREEIGFDNAEQADDRLLIRTIFP